jgi:HEPN domain-containing protein
MPGATDLAKQGLAKAENDLLNADNNLAANHVPCDTVCFHCQQAVEKMLKAFLINEDRPYPISHDLLLILEQILEVEPQAEVLRPRLALLNPYAVAVRYPDTEFTPALDDAREARSTAQEIHRWLKNKRPRLFTL